MQNSGKKNIGKITLLVHLGGKTWAVNLPIAYFNNVIIFLWIYQILLLLFCAIHYCRQYLQNFKQSRNSLYANNKRKKVRGACWLHVLLYYIVTMTTRCSCAPLGRLQRGRTDESSNS